MPARQEPFNVAAYITQRASAQPYRPAVIFPAGNDASGRFKYTFMNFRQLEAETNRLADGMKNYGLTPGMRTVIMVKPSLDFFALTFACFKSGIVPVMIDPGMGLEKMKKCVDEVAPEAFIGIPRAHLARKLFHWGTPGIHRLITVGPRLGWGGATLSQIRARGRNIRCSYCENTSPGDMAAILFTSGSTGVPKGVVYTHGIFASQIRLIRSAYNIEPGEIDLCTFPLFALFAPALGMTAVIPRMDATRPASVNPRNIIRAIEDFGVTNMFGSPALLNTVGRFIAANNVAFPTLRRIITAGAPIQPATLRLFANSLAESTEIYTGYGATEAMPVTTLGSRTILAETCYETDSGAGVCVGKPLPEMEVFILPVSDDPIAAWSEKDCLPTGKIGEIVVRGPVVTPYYFNRPDHTRQAKIKDSDGTILHRMGDLGYFDSKGRLWFCGRKSHRVTTPGTVPDVFYTVCCEGVFNTHPDVFRTALVRCEIAGRAVPVLCVELHKKPKNSKKRIVTQLRELAEKYPHTRPIQTFLFVSRFPVDIRHNAKIFREKLAELARKKLG